MSPSNKGTDLSKTQSPEEKSPTSPGGRSYARRPSRLIIPYN